ncbi:hypothetical protein AWH56_004210 [Anaerobacillus isosaccharinicus]|uniref:FAD/FMN-containing dehydrogenase n=1 Tax=Anaerobacillus isosaccharinicus TaxID=1532552 RepID=A0A1S2KW49_9BACI|nr:hypothetical protein [Anaerobacillus isosaccharinicus]MBA5584770.1 hypothetical protein [Anaerobacillus isosaccharinicus]QOY36864.1 hypothetical protein AWH56_004210 [Anaerobacillus isosaccharinicus]
MKKKVIAVLTATSLVLGIGSVALANSDNDVFENFNFKDMLPFMQEMHPDLEEEQLEEMYNRCHGEGGMMQGKMGGMMQGMMKSGNFEGMKKMMKSNSGTEL